MSKFYVFLIFFISFTNGNSQYVVENIETDSTYNHTYKEVKLIDSVLIDGYITDNKLTPRKFRDNFIKHYKTSEFNYTPQAPKPTGWDKLMRKIAELLRDIFGSTDARQTVSYGAVFLKILGFLLLGFVLYLVISYFVSVEGNFIFKKKNRLVKIDSEDITENIHEINFSEKILQSEKSKDFRTAIRYQFLNVLKKLSDKRMIDWNTDKTNHDYLKEITQEKTKSFFSEMLYIFEYVWYGEFEIDEEAYQHFKKKFEISG